MRVIFIGLLLILLTINALHAREIVRVAVAANFLLPMQKIKNAFEKEYGHQVQISSASSGVLTAQIKNGAPFHIFLSADMKYPNFLFSEGLAMQEPEIFVYGRLAFWSKNERNLVPINTFLHSDNVNLVAIAQPELAPYGFYAMEWMKGKGILETIKQKLIYGENIGKVNQYILSGSVDAAFTSNSAMFVDKLKSKGYWELLDNDSNYKIPHGVVVIQGKEISSAVMDFYRYIFGINARAIFSEFGYISPDKR